MRMLEVDALDSKSAAAAARRWIEALYLDLVGHLPDRDALARWTTAARRGVSHREIATGILTSSECCSSQIAAQYRALLDRDPDTDDLAAWTAKLGSGLPLQDVIAALCDGSEYKTNHPEPGAFVESLYRRLLHRASDPDSKAGWMGALHHRSSTLAVIRGILNSTEYGAQRVTALFAHFLDREPESTELYEQVVALIQGAPLQRLVLDLVTSSEYLARTATRAAELAAAPAAGAAARAPSAGLSGAPSAGLAAGRSSDPDPGAGAGSGSDAEVLARLDRGDARGALALLMQRHGAAVYRYCRTELDDAALADDVHQQVFIEAFRDLPRFARRSTTRTWLLGIARHRVLDAAKRRRRARCHVDAAASIDVPDPQRLADDGLDQALLHAALTRCVAGLDEPVRTAVLLRYQQGLTYEAMAEICGEKPGTLQARVVRALRKLRDMIQVQIDAQTRGDRRG